MDDHCSTLGTDHLIKLPVTNPFWISLRGIPLHYWHEKVVRNIGLELGELETYEVTKTSTRVRVMVDGSKPLIMEAAMEFDSGEESIISLHYENLGNHCSICYRLSHLQSHCPERPILIATRQTDTKAVGQPIRQTTPISSHSVPWNPTTTTEGDNRPYQQRLDRHGKPFGDRFSTALFRPTGPKNKIAPRLPHDYDRSKENLRENDEKEYSSPPYTRRRLNNHGEAQRRENHSTRHRGSPTLQWRAKSPLINPTDKGQGSETHNEGNSRAPKQWRARSPLLAQEATPPSALFQPPRSSVGRNLNVMDFPPDPTIPYREEVMEELREVTLQYIKCADPVESATRKQRVLLSELDGTVDETATKIIQASTSAAMIQQERYLEPTIQLPPPRETEPAASGPTANPARKRRRPRRTTDRRTTVKHSPKTFLGTGSRK
ncbi:uncharacterized protein At4g02000-like [Brassica napus]|uniref:uncharacterized protein At4g02000-like n=1 Tax=Brassica napus TaxID=3708 RepID=UPI00207A6D08|nr:uncharacterized protein At4g02000-like [Brassica napus]